LSLNAFVTPLCLARHSLAAALTLFAALGGFVDFYVTDFVLVLETQSSGSGGEIKKSLRRALLDESQD
jgi:hypothetical protein